MRAKREEWLARVASWKSSGLSQSAWCREHGVPLASFSYWQRKLSGQEESVAAVLPIRVAAPMLGAWEVHLPNGIVLRMPEVDATAALPLLRALAAC